VVTRYDGSPWLLDSKETLATNGVIHDEMMRAFAAIFSGHEMEPLPSAEEWARERAKG
jgi:myo-inositol-1(or 4)-monophosphatase